MLPALMFAATLASATALAQGPPPPPGPPGPSLPWADAVAELQTRLSTFDTLRLTVLAHDDAPATRRRKRWVVYLTRDAGVTVDATNSGTRYHWDETTLWRDRSAVDPAEEAALPFVGPLGAELATPFVAGLLAELRAGFPGATWTDAPPASVGLDVQDGHHWVHLELPFGWAAPVDVFLAMAPWGHLTHLVLTDGEWEGRVTLERVEPEAPIPPDALQPERPIDELAHPMNRWHRGGAQ